MSAPGPAPAKVSTPPAPIAPKIMPKPAPKVAAPKPIPKIPVAVKHEKTHKVEKETIQQQSDIHQEASVDTFK